MPASLLGKYFASPKKCWTSWGKIRKAKNTYVNKIQCNTTIDDSIRRPRNNSPFSTYLRTVMYRQPATQFASCTQGDEVTQVLLNTGLLATIEALEYENRELKQKLLQSNKLHQVLLPSISLPIMNWLGYIIIIFHHMKLSYLFELLDLLWMNINPAEKRLWKKHQHKRTLSSQDKLISVMITLKLNLHNKDLRKHSAIFCA